MRTINFELSKRLNDLWLLDNIETKCSFFKKESKEVIKTLTLEEAIEFLNDNNFILKFRKDNDKRLKYNYYVESNRIGIYPSWNSYIKCIEDLLEYSLTNNLLKKIWT